MKTWKKALASFGRHLLGSAAAVLAVTRKVPETAQEWTTFGWAIVIAGVMTAARAVNPKDGEYGVGSPPAPPKP